MREQLLQTVAYLNGTLILFWFLNSGQVQLRLTFNYHFIYKDIPASHMEAASIVHNLLSILSHQYFFWQISNMDIERLMYI